MALCNCVYFFHLFFLRVFFFWPVRISPHASRTRFGWRRFTALWYGCRERTQAQFELIIDLPELDERVELIALSELGAPSQLESLRASFSADCDQTTALTDVHFPSLTSARASQCSCLAFSRRSLRSLLENALFCVFSKRQRVSDVSVERVDATAVKARVAPQIFHSSFDLVYIFYPLLFL